MLLSKSRIYFLPISITEVSVSKNVLPYHIDETEYSLFSLDGFFSFQKIVISTVVDRK